MENPSEKSATTPTPLAAILDKLNRLIWKESRNEPLITFCNLQLSLLNTVYRSMCEFDMRLLRQSDSTFKKKQENAEIFLGFGRKHMEVEKAFLDYFSYINILNQFGRVLANKYNLPASIIPDYARIYFFRNKVLEHWDDYTININYGALTQQYGKPATPVIQNLQSLTQLLPTKEKIIQYFKSKGIQIEIEGEDQKLLYLSLVKPEYNDKVYNALELIDPQLRGIDEIITKLLFDFGFPVPIFDVEEYCAKLADSIDKIT